MNLQMKHQSLTQLSTETTYDEIFLSSLRLTDSQNVHLEWLPTAAVERSQAARLQVPAAEHRVTLVPQGDNVTWQNAAFMAFDVLYPAEHNGTLLLHFYVKGESQARFNVRLGLFPQLLTRITLPLTSTRRTDDLPAAHAKASERCVSGASHRAERTVARDAVAGRRGH
jgi:hypothetical protein